MIRDITIGQYFPGKSPIHNLDARLKLVLTFVYIVSIFFCKNFVSLGVSLVYLVIAVLLSRISLKLIAKSLKPIVIIVLLTSVLQIFYNNDGTVLFRRGWFEITTGGLIMAVFTSVRIVALVLASSLLTYTTSPTLLTDAIERLFSPLKKIKINVHTIAMMMTIALRFIPLLIDEVDKIMSAQKARGAQLDSGGVLKRGQALVPVFIPLFVNAFTRAYDLAFAMECRCYRGGEGRTRLRVMKFCKRDYAAIAITVVCLAGIGVSNAFLTALI